MVIFNVGYQFITDFTINQYIENYASYFILLPFIPDFTVDV